MKKILAVALLMATSVAMAQTTPQTQQGQQQQQSSTSQADASNAGNVQTVNGPTIVVNTAPATDTRDVLPPQTINQNVRQEGDTTSRVIYGGSQTVKNVPSVGGPPLTSSNDTCMGSSSGSVNAPGFGVSLGTTWTDNNCRMLKNSRELWNMGMKAAALALMCTDPMNREALELTGFKCPQSKDESKRVVKADGTHYTDPIVRARLGLPPLE